MNSKLERKQSERFTELLETSAARLRSQGVAQDVIVSGLMGAAINEAMRDLGGPLEVAALFQQTADYLCDAAVPVRGSC